MDLFKSLLSITLITLAKLSFVTSAEAKQITDSKEMKEIESNFLFQSLMKKVSPKDFQKLNAKDHDMSFKDF